MHRDGPGREFNRFTVAGQVVGALAIKFHGGEARRYLLDRAGKSRQQSFNRAAIRTDAAGANDTAFGIVGVAFFAPADGEAVSLSSVKDEWDRFGRFPERDR